MKANTLKNSLLAALLAGAPFAAEAQTTLEWTALGGARQGDLAGSQALAAGAARNLPGVSREPVAFAYALPADQAAIEAAKPFVAESREYWMEVSGAQLRSGVALETTAPGALVRVNPAAAAQRDGRASSLALDPAGFELRSGEARFTAGTGMELLASAEALQQAGTPFAEGTSAFRIAPQVGAGRLILAAPLAAGAERYVIHVFEPRSEQKLVLTTDQGNYLHGQQLVVETSLGDGAGRLRFDQVEAFVSAPSGRAWPLSVVRQKDGSYRGAITLDGREAGPQGLWEVNIAARAQGADGLTVVRGARTAFACALPTAALEGQAGIAREGKQLRVELPLQVGVAGRYEVRAILYGTNAQGELRPIEVAHFANWLEAGRASLGLTFEHFGAFKAPFEVRDLRLHDQGRMGLLHRQELALVLP